MPVEITARKKPFRQRLRRDMRENWVVYLLLLPVIIWYSLFFHRKFRKGFQECDENEGKLSAMVQENLTGVRVVRAFGQQEYEVEKFEKNFKEIKIKNSKAV